MQVDVYLNKDTRKKILLVAPGKDLSELPAKVQEFASDLVYHDKWEVGPETPRIGLNSNEAVQSVTEKGYYAGTADIRIETSIG